MKLTLIYGETTFTWITKGLLVTVVGEHTYSRFLIPRVRMIRTFQFSKRTIQVMFGRSLTLIMDDKLWAEHEEDIMHAVFGEGVK